MARPAPPEIESAGSDSFLDVVTNIVGILIILVMVVGERARRAPVAEGDSAPAENALAPDLATANSLQTEVQTLNTRIREVQLETATRFRERAALSTLLTAAEQELGQRRSALDDHARAAYDLKQALAVATADLKNIEQRKVAAKLVSRSVKIESYSTPISKAVDGKELHFQLKGGRIAYIPLDELLEKFRSGAREKAWKLKDLPEMTETVGPVGGFHLRYKLERHDIPMEEVLATGRGGTIIQLTKWELIPVSGELGETLEQALKPGSEFESRTTLASPTEYTVTLWAYPEGFADFRRLRKELYERGYSVAGRPLPDGVAIGGSPKGTKSAAE